MTTQFFHHHSLSVYLMNFFSHFKTIILRCNQATKAISFRIGGSAQAQQTYRSADNYYITISPSRIEGIRMYCWYPFHCSSTPPPPHSFNCPIKSQNPPKLLCVTSYLIWNMAEMQQWRCLASYDACLRAHTIHTHILLRMKTEKPREIHGKYCIEIKYTQAQCRALIPFNPNSFHCWFQEVFVYAWKLNDISLFQIFFLMA